MSGLCHIKIDIKHLRDGPDQRHLDFSLQRTNCYIKNSISVTAILVVLSVLEWASEIPGQKCWQWGTPLCSAPQKHWMTGGRSEVSV